MAILPCNQMSSSTTGIVIHAEGYASYMAESATLSRAIHYDLTVWKNFISSIISSTIHKTNSKIILHTS